MLIRAKPNGYFENIDDDRQEDNSSRYLQCLYMLIQYSITFQKTHTRQNKNLFPTKKQKKKNKNLRPYLLHSLKHNKAHTRQNKNLFPTKKKKTKNKNLKPFLLHLLKHNKACIIRIFIYFFLTFVFLYIFFSHVFLHIFLNTYFQLFLSIYIKHARASSINALYLFFRAKVSLVTTPADSPSLFLRLAFLLSTNREYYHFSYLFFKYIFLL